MCSYLVNAYTNEHQLYFATAIIYDNIVTVNINKIFSS